MKKAKNTGMTFQEYERKQHLIDPKTIFLDNRTKQPLVDLLETIESGFDGVWMAEDYCDKDGLSIAVGALDATLREIVKKVRESGLLEAVLIDSKHPRFESVHGAIYTAFSVDRETEILPSVIQ